MYPDNCVRGSSIVCYHMLCVLTTIYKKNNYFSLAYPFIFYVFVSCLVFLFCNDHQMLVWAYVETHGDHHGDGDTVV